ncbi:MAG: DpnD/PcfM family protein [Blautia sp.]|nr:DpnD/PcfM family protein [Oliverpabstia sp.]MDY4000454.1 DpnD/PcfM family protein [Blautia sp.]
MEEKEYEVTIREILQRSVRQRASSEEEARDLVEARYRAGEIVLEADVFFDHEFECREVLPVLEKNR